MIFFIEDIRSKKTFNLTSNEFRDFIIKKTKSVYENSPVTQERTNHRYPILTDIQEIDKKITVQSNLFLITALSRINNDKFSRYILLIDGDQVMENIILNFHEYVPIYRVQIKNSNTVQNTPSDLSKWFRSTMGRGFSFVDIDYFLFKGDFTRVLMIEEKASNNSYLGFGQKISYQEMMNDVIKFNSKLTVIFKEPNENHLKSFSLIKNNANISYERNEFDSKSQFYQQIIEFFKNGEK